MNILGGAAIGKDVCNMTKLAEEESKARKRVNVECHGWGNSRLFVALDTMSSPLM